MTEAARRPPPRRAFAGAFAALLALSGAATGCVETMSRSATKGVLEATKEHERKPDANEAAKRLVADVTSDPGVRRATRELAAAGVHGVADGMREEIAGIDTEGFADDAARAVGERVRGEMAAAFDAATPRLQAAVRAAAAEAVLGMSGAMRESAERDAPAIAQAIVAALTEAMSAPAGAPPAAPDPALGGAAPPEAEAPADRLVRSAVRSAVLGLEQGARDAGVGDRDPHGALYDALRRVGFGLGEGMPAGMIRSNPTFFVGMPFVLATLPLLVSVVVLVLAWRLYRRSSEAMARLLQAASAGPGSPPRPPMHAPHASPAE
jgi:hypothetical protein